MVPFSLIPDLSYSRGMKKRIYTLRPAAMGLGDNAAVAGLFNNNWVQRHAGHAGHARPGFKAVLKEFKVI